MNADSASLNASLGTKHASELLMIYVHVTLAARTPTEADRTSRRAAYRRSLCVNNLAIQHVHVQHCPAVIDAERALNVLSVHPALVAIAVLCHR